MSDKVQDREKPARVPARPFIRAEVSNNRHIVPCRVLRQCQLEFNKGINQVLWQLPLNKRQASSNRAINKKTEVGKEREVVVQKSSSSLQACKEEEGGETVKPLRQRNTPVRRQRQYSSRQPQRERGGTEGEEKKSGCQVNSPKSTSS